jgi:hypothetical protein
MDGARCCLQERPSHAEGRGSDTQEFINPKNLLGIGFAAFLAIIASTIAILY